MANPKNNTQNNPFAAPDRGYQDSDGDYSPYGQIGQNTNSGLTPRRNPKNPLYVDSKGPMSSLQCIPQAPGFYPTQIGADVLDSILETEDDSEKLFNRPVTGQNRRNGSF